MKHSETLDGIYDLILIGFGVAGSRLLYHLLKSSWCEKRILILEKNLKSSHNHGLAFWQEKVKPTDLMLHKNHEWSAIQVIDQNGRIIRRHLHEYIYFSLPKSSLIQEVQTMLCSHANIDLQEEEVQEIYEGNEIAEVVTLQKRYFGHWVFDSRKPQSFTVMQHFFGVTIETSIEHFDPTAATLFDLRFSINPQIFAFVYLLPFSPRRALVEAVTIGSVSANLEPELYTFLQQTLSLGDFHILAKEGGTSPLLVPKRHQKGRILDIGVRGGMLKPSTGYALTRIDADSQMIVASLVRYGHPFAFFRSRWHFRLLDRLLLNMIGVLGERAYALFPPMFQDPDRLFRFLDEKAGFLEIFKIAASLPKRLAFSAFRKLFWKKLTIPMKSLPKGSHQ